MKTPILDHRNLEQIMEELAAHARQYTPEWRYEQASDDPGAAIAQLFGEMFHQTVDRFNSVPEKLFIEFLELIGVTMPDPVPAQGLLQFHAHETVEEPVPVPEGTQVYARQQDGQPVVYETERRIESTAARLEHVFYADAREGLIEKVELSRPRLFFTSNGSANLQCHRFSISQDDVLHLSGSGAIELEVRSENRFTAEETAQLLGAPDMRWSYRCGGVETVFEQVRVEGDRIFLTKSQSGVPDVEADGLRYISCEGSAAGGTVRVDGIRLRSIPDDWCPVEEMAFGDAPIQTEEGGYCFGRRPTTYGLFYLRSDEAFCKRGAQVNLRLELTPIVSEPENIGPKYEFTQMIVDKKAAVTVKPDDVYVDEVIWEYYNGMGWTQLTVSGNRNPFSCKETGRLETVFTVPEDLCLTEVNARSGCYIRARVLHVENEFSATPRWIVPFVRSAACKWQYAKGRPVHTYRSRNNGDTTELIYAEEIGSAQFPAIVSMTEEPRAMYFCFDKSPHAMPLSIYFEMAGRAALDDKVTLEAWNGKRFEPVRFLDLTRNFLYSGLMLLYLPLPLPRTTMFGQEGCWLRAVRSSYSENTDGYPRVSAIHLNTVNAVQRRQEGEQYFDTEIYEAGKQLELPEKPVQNCSIWVDELQGLAVSEAEKLAEAMPERVRLEREGDVLTRCWILWDRTTHLAMARSGDRVYELDPYEGLIRFGNGICGKVPPMGMNNILVRYASGGGTAGNRPVGTITQPVGSLPRISDIENLTPMSGGTDRFRPEQVQALGNKRLRHRNRALGIRDFEEMVAEEFPQVFHVKCFSQLDAGSRKAPGHVTLVVDTRDSNTGRAASDLCDRIYAYLEPRCSCTLTAGKRLHVIPATAVQVNTEITVDVTDLDQAAVTQQLINSRLQELIDRQWRMRDIGEQVRVNQIWQIVRDTPNVRLVRQILVEGVYEENGMTRHIPLETDHVVPYATVRSGSHVIRLG